MKINFIWEDLNYHHHHPSSHGLPIRQTVSQIIPQIFQSCYSKLKIYDLNSIQSFIFKSRRITLLFRVCHQERENRQIYESLVMFRSERRGVFRIMTIKSPLRAFS